MDKKEASGLLWSSELATLERTIAAVQFRKEYLFLQSKRFALPASELNGEINFVSVHHQTFKLIVRVQGWMKFWFGMIKEYKNPPRMWPRLPI